MAKTIGILTGGGDVPGLNAIIKRATVEGIGDDYRIIGLRRGWGSLVYMDPSSTDIDPEHAEMLTLERVRKIDREGGTTLHTSRVNPLEAEADRKFQRFRGFSFEGKRDLTEDVLKNLDNLGIDVLIAIGGDDTLRYARHLVSLGRKVVGIPKTMDGDVYGAGYCIGFYTAVTRADELTTRLRTPCGSHERVGIIELFGRYSGLVALYSAIAADPHRVLIPEVPFNIGKVIQLIGGDLDNNPSNYAILLVAEGAKPEGEDEHTRDAKKDGFGHKKLGGIGKYIAGEFDEAGFETIENPLTYLLRSGPPDARDKIMAHIYANLAIDAIKKGESGVLTAIENGKCTLVPLEITVNSPLKVDVGRLYNTEEYRPKLDGFKDSGLLL